MEKLENSRALQPEFIEVPESRLSVLDGMKKKIGIIKLWPQQAAAEHESIERYRFACSLIGVELVELDRTGFFINGPVRRVARDDVDFVISLHFETPKCYDCFSWGALWNPVDFYVDWGFDTFVDHQFSHDGYFTCGSPVVDRLFKREMGDNYAATPKVQVNHSLSGPVYRATERDDRRLVYCGINWERLSSKPGRFDHLLAPLDRAGVLDIFGPEELQNVRVWEGFEGYRHEVPFDGKSLILEIAASGAVLALSSNAHLRSSIMTSRLFEGAAAGALVFADGNGFVERYFSNETVPIKITGEAKTDASQIIEALEYYNENPHEAFEKAKALQDKYLDGYMLHSQLLNAYAEFDLYKIQSHKPVEVNGPQIGYIILWPDRGIGFPNKLVDSIKRQTFGRACIRVITTGRSKKAAIDDALPETDFEIVYFDNAYDKPNAVGSFIADVVDSMPEEVRLVSIHTSGLELFADFSAKMAAAATSNALGAVCALLACHCALAEQSLRGNEFVDYWRPRSSQKKHQKSFGNMMFQRDYLETNAGVLQMLDYAALVKFFYKNFPEMQVVDSPLIWLDLNIFEADVRLDLSPYQSSETFIQRYFGVASGDAERLGSEIADLAVFFNESLIRPLAGSRGAWHRTLDRFCLAHARRAARRKDWAAAASGYARLLKSNGAQPALWKQYGHSLKEMERLGAARFCYRCAVALDPSDSDAKQHLQSLDSRN